MTDPDDFNDPKLPLVFAIAAALGLWIVILSFLNR